MAVTGRQAVRTLGTTRKTPPSNTCDFTTVVH